MEPDNQEQADWLHEVTADPMDSGLLDVIEQLRHEEDDTEDQPLR